MCDIRYCQIQARRIESIEKPFFYLTFISRVLPSTSSVLEYFTVYKVDFFLYTFDNQIIYIQNKERKNIYIHVCIHFKYWNYLGLYREA